MTTSQASRVYGIPYNSLLMYVRGKYGKSLKLDKIKETTLAAKDNLNTIGNSRSTPKEKMDKKTKHGSGSSIGSVEGGNPPKKIELENFMAIFPPLGGNGGNVENRMENRMKDVMAQMQNRQALLDQSEKFKELEKHMGPEQAKLLMPFFTGATPPVVPAPSLTSVTDNVRNGSNGGQSPSEEVENIDQPKENNGIEDNTNTPTPMTPIGTPIGTPSQDDNKNELKPLEVSNQGGEISAQ